MTMLGLPAVRDLVEAEAVSALQGVGGDHEWWIWQRRVGHLRVPLVAEEIAQLAPGLAVDDAGETGPMRPRTA